MYVLIGLTVICAAMSGIITMMALLNFQWVVAAVFGLMCCALLYSLDCLAKVIEET